MFGLETFASLSTLSNALWRWRPQIRFSRNGYLKRSQTTILTESPTRFDFPEEGVNLTAHLDQLEKTYVMEALRRTSGNQTNAAQMLALSVRSLRHLLDKHGIRGLTAQMRDDRRTSDSAPRRRATDPSPRRREDDESEIAATAGEP